MVQQQKLGSNEEVITETETYCEGLEQSYFFEVIRKLGKRCIEGDLCLKI